MSSILVWRTKTGKYEYGSNAYLGEWLVGSVGTPVQSSSYKGPRWHPETTLPGVRVKPDLFFDTEDQARESLERVARLWITKAGLAPPA